MEKYYKVLNLDGTTCHGGNGKWYLPHGQRPGKWMPAIADIKPCARGYHICERGQLVQWLGPAIYEVEWRGEIIRQEDKCVVSQARLIRKLDTWDERTARLFACDCADEALKLIREPDPRSIEAVRIARLYAIGKANPEQLVAAIDAAMAAAIDAAMAAARAAAMAAARSAARAAAIDAAMAAAMAAARSAARAAAMAAARSAARAAAIDAAMAAARAWQTNKLFEYLVE